MKPCEAMRVLILMAITLLIVAPECAAGELNFNHLVAGIEQRYQIRHTRIPLIGLASLCARVHSGGGVRGLRVADFEDIRTSISGDDFNAYMRSQLGNSWNVLLSSREKTANENTVIFARAKGSRYVLIVADAAGNELSLIRVEMDASNLDQSHLLKRSVLSHGTSPDAPLYITRLSNMGANQ